MKLAIETATSRGSVATMDADGAVVCRELGAQRDHARRLATEVRDLVGDFERIDGYALSIGPGSFTGLRVGLSFLKGLAMVHPRPAVGIGTLLVMAEGILRVHPEARWALPVLDARRDEVFAALVSRDGVDDRLPVGVYRAPSLADRIAGIDGVWIAGDGSKLELGGAPWQMADEGVQTPLASDLVALAAPKFVRGETVDPQDLEPLYLQLSAAEQNLGLRADGLSVKGPTRGV